ncbi:MAG: hypothetical protein ACLVES_02240 [Faecalibacterium prausnitzii]
MESIQLLLDVGQHLVHIAAAGVERHFMFHYPGRADLLCHAEHHGCAAQRYQQRPQLICWQRRAQHREHQRRRIPRQDAGLLGADNFAHAFSPFPKGRTAPCTLP